MEALEACPCHPQAVEEQNRHPFPALVVLVKPEGVTAHTCSAGEENEPK